MNTVYVIEKAVVDTVQGEVGLYHSSGNTIMVIKGTNITVSEPDNLERLIWLNRFGLMSDTDFVTEAQKYQGIEMKRQLLTALKAELEPIAIVVSEPVP